MSKSDSETLIKVTNLSKKFCRDFKRSLWYGLKEMGDDIFHPFHDDKEPNLSPSEFWANKDISFEVKRGECLGVIGRNGAGKTTLLKMLNGIIKPDHGTIEIKGKVGALIALGAGFNPILTGRENIYVNGAILGLTKKEIKDKIHNVLKFAEISEAIDAPVRTYSSGMKVRLGFAIASILLLPDILIIDEVLAVGDTAFKVRCYNRIKELLPSSAVIFVSHNMFDINRICTKMVVLNKGKVAFHGGVEEGIHKYNSLNNDLDSKNEFVVHKESFIKSVTVNHVENSSSNLDTTLNLHLGVISERACGAVKVRLIFFDEIESPVAEWDSSTHECGFNILEGESKLLVLAERIRLKSGNYRVIVIASDLDNKGYYFSVEHGVRIVIENNALSGAAYKV